MKHNGFPMAENLMDYRENANNTRNFDENVMKNRPKTADIVTGQIEEEQVPKAMRVKPEASDIYNKNRGTLSEIYGNYNKNVFGTRNSVGLDANPSKPTKNGPIIIDPTYTSYSPRRQDPARVKPEAKDVADHGINGTLGRILQESYDAARRRNIRNAQKDGNRVKNFIGRNVGKVKKYEAQQKQRLEESIKVETPAKELWRSKAYGHVKNKVLTRPRTADPEAARGSMKDVGVQSQIDENGNMKIIVEHDNKKPVDIIARNRRAAIEHGKRKNAHVSEINSIRNQKKHIPRPQTAPGTVPKYIEKMNEQRRQEILEKRKNAIDPDCPKGHRKLSDSERREMLSTLRQAQKKLNGQLSTVTTVNTLRNKKYKEQILAQISETDEAIRIFSRPKVFIKI